MSVELLKGVHANLPRTNLLTPGGSGLFRRESGLNILVFGAQSS